MNNSSQWVGIDVSKATLDVYIRPLGKATRFANTAEDISQLVEELKSTPLNLIVLEATGGLETELVIQLQAAGLPVALINPRQGRDFGKALADIEAHIDYLDQRLDELNQEIEQLTQTNQQWLEKVNLLKTMPGIGQVISATLVSDLPELGQLTAKQISRLVGVAPINHDSGQHKGKRMIQGGRAHVRALLYMGAVVAMRYNPVIKAF